jgi:MoxR-like ATPase
MEPEDGLDPSWAQRTVGRIRDAVGSVLVGKEDVVERLMVALLCRGHVLLEDVPGVGKTLLVRSLATAMGCSFQRIQFTSDVMPSDVTGSSVFNQRTGDFEFRHGPIFCQILLADEINRATPRAQSALLEAMQERQVTVDGHTVPLPEPFFVLATQNPIDFEGTFSLPEAQLDRFLIRLAPGYPTREEEGQMLRRFEHEDPFAKLVPVVSETDVVALQEQRSKVRVGEPVREYLLDVVRATRTDDQVVLGGSPRATLALASAIQARALLHGRVFAVPDDVKQLASDVLAHRLVLNAQARLRAQTAVGVIGGVLDRVAVPVEDELVG